MTAQPVPEALLARYGYDAAGRQRAREEMTCAIVARARHEARLAGLTLTCRDRLLGFGPAHAPCGNPGGGRTCLCSCHDSQAAAPESAP